jgi:hypothetical protein
VTITSARSIYDLHVIDPTTAERYQGHILTVIVELLAGLTAGTVGGGSMMKLTLEVVDIRNGSTVLTMREDTETAHGLAELIETDLDRLDAAAFAREWGIEGERRS